MNETDPNIAARQRWMGVLARAGDALDAYEAALKDSASYVGVVSEEVQSAVLGKKDAKQAAADMQARIEKLLN